MENLCNEAIIPSYITLNINNHAKDVRSSTMLQGSLFSAGIGRLVSLLTDGFS